MPYVRRVFILDDCDELMPKCLNFVKGAAASEDLPPDISRETLQLNRFFQENLLKKSLVTFAEFADQNAVFPKSMSSRFKVAEPLHYQTSAPSCTSAVSSCRSTAMISCQVIEPCQGRCRL